MIRHAWHRAVGLVGVFVAAVALVVPAAAAPQSTAKTTSTTKKATATKKPAKSSAAARRRAAERARAQAAARALAEAQQPRFRLDENGLQVPDIRAEAAIIYDPQTGNIVWESNSQNKRSIASITKVMTAVVFLENAPDLDRKVTVLRSDVANASTTHLKAGWQVTAGDLLHLTLIASDNAAARALARISPHGSAGFIDRMNEKARELGLNSTSYADPSGLLADNVSSAYDMARLITFVSDDPRLTDVMQMQDYRFTVGTRTVQVRSTNQLVTNGDVDVRAGKTGFIRKAGYCLATLLRLPQGGPPVAVVVLGAQSNAGRFWETRHLLNWMMSQASELFAGPALQAQVQ